MVRAIREEKGVEALVAHALHVVERSAGEDEDGAGCADGLHVLQYLMEGGALQRSLLGMMDARLVFDEDAEVVMSFP